VPERINVNPLSINPLILLVGIAAAMSIGFGGGWTANGWRLGAKIADVKAERSNEIAIQNKEVLDDFVATAKKIREQADGANADFSELAKDLTAIRKEFKDANAKPLPVDCHPDAPRVRKLTNAIDAVDHAIARHGPSD